MTVGALLDAGADWQALRSRARTVLNLGADFRLEKTKRKGIAASKFSVEHRGTEEAPASAAHRKDHLRRRTLGKGARQRARGLPQSGRGGSEVARCADRESAFPRSRRGGFDLRYRRALAWRSICWASKRFTARASTSAAAPLRRSTACFRFRRPPQRDLLTGKPIYSRGPADGTDHADGRGACHDAGDRVSARCLRCDAGAGLRRGR